MCDLHQKIQSGLSADSMCAYSTDTRRPPARLFCRPYSRSGDTDATFLRQMTPSRQNIYLLERNETKP